MPRWSAERRAAAILAAIAITEGSWVAFNLRVSLRGFLRYTGWLNAGPAPLGWLLALIVAAAFTAIACRLPSVRANLFTISWLKVLALAVAIAAGFCEEAIFRKLLMDALAHGGTGLTMQVLASGLAFGLVHGIWGAFRGSVTAAIGATVATGVLGLALAVVYLASHRVLAPCIVSHLLINALAEPGLVLAAVRGEMGAPA
jgi:membrane protease YdiL (CAAX protease family)